MPADVQERPDVRAGLQRAGSGWLCEQGMTPGRICVAPPIRRSEDESLERLVAKIGELGLTDHVVEL